MLFGLSAGTSGGAQSTANVLRTCETPPRVCLRCMGSLYTAWDIQRLEAVQRRAARFVTNNHKRTEGMVTNIMKDLQWPSLEQRRKTNRSAIMYKIQNDQIAIPIPHYLHRQTAQTQQFHPQRFRTVAIHSDTYKHSFFPRTIKDWNSLIPSMYDAKSLVVFKRCIQNV